MNKYGFVLFDCIAGALFLLLSSFSLNGGLIGFLLLYVYQLHRLFSKEWKLQRTSVSLIRFNTFFFLMYSVCTYLIAISYLFGIGEEVKLLGMIDYKNEYIPTAYFLSTIAVSFYSYGYLRAYYRSRNNRSVLKPIPHFNLILRICNLLAILVSLFFTYNFLQVKAAGGRDVSGVVGTLVNCLIILPVALCGYMNQFRHLSLWGFVKKYRVIVACILYIAISMLSIGDRLMAICLFSSSVYIINEFVYKFPKSQIIIATLSGMFFMFLISFTRGSSTLSAGVSAYSESENKLQIFQDVYPANACLVLGTEIEQEKGLYKPLKIIPLSLSPLPFVPSAIKVAFFGGDFSSASYLTSVNKGRLDVGDSGLGTHVVADIYLSWGVLGVAFLFSIFGYMVGICYIRRNSIYCYVASVGFVAWSVFIPRESLFDPYRDIVWMIAVLYLLSSLKHKKNESYLVQR